MFLGNSQEFFQVTIMFKLSFPTYCNTIKIWENTLQSFILDNLINNFGNKLLHSLHHKEHAKNDKVFHKPQKLYNTFLILE
jgi:hypothetical protein